MTRIHRGFLAALALLVLAVCPCLAEGKRHAVLVGPKVYDHSKLDALTYTENDVTALAELLRSAGYEVVLLTDATGTRDAKLAPTRANIEARLADVLDRCKRDDLVVLAFAGHGLQFDDDPDCYFCPRDANPARSKKATLISLSKVYKQLDECGAGAKVLLADCCRTDPNPGRGRDIKGDVLDKAPPKGVYAFFSCSRNERAYEHPDLKHGVFFHHVIQGLNSAVQDLDEEVTFEALALYVRRKVPADARRLFKKKQTPNLKAADVAGDPLVLLSRAERVIAADITAVEGMLKAGRGSQAYIEKADGQRVALWRKAAEGGMPRAQFLYSRALSLGVGVKKDEAEAFRWGEKAAAQSYDLAQNLVGFSYAGGRGVVKDEKSAFRWYRKAADQGLAIAQHNVGDCYLNGTGVERDAKEGARWVTKAAEQGCSTAQERLGVCYVNGQGVARDARAGVKWFRKSVDNGNGTAASYLAHCYRHGLGVSRDGKEAMRWYRQAAETGQTSACYELGDCYADGNGIEADKAEAEKWFLKGAEAGDSRCQVRIGRWLAEGEGGVSNLADAMKWLRKAEAGAATVQRKRQITRELAEVYRLNGLDQLRRGQKEQAWKWFQDALKMLQTLDKEDPGRFEFETGLARCFHSMGEYHEKESDLGKAAAQYQKAVGLRHSLAAKRLAEMYEKGEGVPQDKKKATALRKLVVPKKARFTIPCVESATGKKIAVHIYVDDSLVKKENPLEAQQLAAKEKGIVFPVEVVDSLKRLRAIAKENNVSFTDLCLYSLSTAAKEDKKPRKDKGKD